MKFLGTSPSFLYVSFWFISTTENAKIISSTTRGEYFSLSSSYEKKWIK